MKQAKALRDIVELLKDDGFKIGKRPSGYYAVHKNGEHYGTWNDYPTLKMLIADLLKEFPEYEK